MFKRKPKYRVNGDFNGYLETKYFRRKRAAQSYARKGHKAGGWMTVEKRKR